MAETKRSLDQKINKHFDQLFAGVGESQALFDLKEELATNLKEKVADYQAQGMKEDQALREAIISMGDLSGLVEDMRQIGQEQAKRTVYSNMRTRIANTGLIAGIILVLFGFFSILMLAFMEVMPEAVYGSSIFIVIGGALLTYSGLIRETPQKYGMHHGRASLYALAIGLLLFGIYVALISGVATNEAYVAISSMMLFVIAGVALFLSLILTGPDRRKNQHYG